MRPEDKGDPYSDRGAPNRTWEENERNRLRELANDPGGLKKVRNLQAPWHKDSSGQG